MSATACQTPLRPKLARDGKSVAVSLAALVAHGFMPGQTPLYDRYGRPFEYLRISVTDQCNLRCIYCMPQEGVPWLPRSELLSFEDLRQIVEAAASCGVWKVRFTGGEPLMRKDFTRLVTMVAAIPGIRDVSMTTNGVLLAQQAEKLARAGLGRINISLDTLRPELFRRITRGGELQDVMAGIDKAQAAGLTPIKLNTVVLGGMNDGEAADLAALTLDRPVEVRFIEYMPLLETKDCAQQAGAFEFVSSHATRSRIEARFGPLMPAHGCQIQSGPAEVFRIAGAEGRVGFVSAMSTPFCKQCDRLRVAADGTLRSCLLDGGRIDLKQALRPTGSRQALVMAMARALWLKPESHKTDFEGWTEFMSRIGG